jgi:hypothetical protein
VYANLLQMLQKLLLRTATFLSMSKIQKYKYTFMYAPMYFCMFVVLWDSSYASCAGIPTPENLYFRTEGMRDLQTSRTEYQLGLNMYWINISQKRLQKFCVTVFIIIIILNPKAFCLTNTLLRPYNCSSTSRDCSGTTENSGVAIYIYIYIYIYES